MELFSGYFVHSFLLNGSLMDTQIDFIANIE